VRKSSHDLRTGSARSAGNGNGNPAMHAQTSSIELMQNLASQRNAWRSRIPAECGWECRISACRSGSASPWGTTAWSLAAQSAGVAISACPIISHCPAPLPDSFRLRVAGFKFDGLSLKPNTSMKKALGVRNYEATTVLSTR
jgi:hypothetical protein